MDKRPEVDINLAQTLETLQAELDPAAYEVAANALRTEKSRRDREKEPEERYTYIGGMIASYEYMLRSDQAHKDGLMWSCYQYLQTPTTNLVPLEIDGEARAFAAYFLASIPYLGETSYQELLEESGVDSNRVLQLLGGYIDSINPQLDQKTVITLDDVEDEQFVGMPWESFLPYPGIIPRLKTGLYQVGYGKMYEDSIVPNQESE